MLRIANAEDRLAIGRVYCEAWKAAYRGMMPDAFLDSLTSENCAPPPGGITPDNCLVWDVAGDICAVAYFGPDRDEAGSGMAEIRSIYVLPAYWNKGIGSDVIQGVFAALKRLGYPEVFLWTLEENARARRFYEKQGMVMTCSREIEIAGVTLAECRYEKDI